MTDAKALVAKVRELSEKATKGPWDVRKYYFDRDEPAANANYEVFPHTDGLKKPADGCGEWAALAECKSYEPNKRNADLIATYRTAAPQLADMLEIALRAIEEAPHSGEACNDAGNLVKRDGFWITSKCTCWKSRVAAQLNTPTK